MSAHGGLTFFCTFNKKTERDRKTERQKDRKTERQKDRKTERQKDREITEKAETNGEFSFPHTLR